MFQKIICFCCLIGWWAAGAQNISFSQTVSRNRTLDDTFKRYRILEMSDNLSRVSDGESITIHLDQDYSFVLRENRILADSYQVSVRNANGIAHYSRDQMGFDGRYFTSVQSGGNQLAFSIFENRYSFYIKTGSREWYIEPLQNFDKTAKSGSYVCYEAKDAGANHAMECGVQSEKKTAISQQTQPVAIGGCKTVALDLAIDYTMFQTYGTINAAINRTLELLNMTQIDYTMANGLLDEVSFKVYEHAVITCDACNYWPTTLEIGDNLDGFYYNGPYGFFVDPQAKIRVLFQNEGGSGIIAGLAIAFDCGISGVAVVKNHIADNDMSRQILSHELGHTLGCSHTDGFIMNPSVNYATTWAPESIATLSNTVNTFTCITDCNPTPCDGKKVSEFAIDTNVTTQQITVSWLSESGMDYKVRLIDLYDYNGSTEFVTLSYPANSISFPIGQLYCNDRYRFIIVPLCDGIEGIADSLFFNVSQNVAAPTLAEWTGFTDEHSGPIYPYQTLCHGRTYSCSITAIDGGSDPVFQWRVNGLPVGGNSNTLTIGSLQDNDVLSCELTSNAACVASPTAYFSTVVHVTDPIALTAETEPLTSTTVCAGESVTVNQSVSLNTAYQVLGGFAVAFIETYFGGELIDSSPVMFPGWELPIGTREFTFVPTTSGDLFFQVYADTDSGGNTLGCYNNSLAASFPVAITVKPCGLGVAQFQNRALRCYPNPTKDIVFVESDAVLSGVEIYNVVGQKVSFKPVQSNHTLIDLSTLSNGIYFLKVLAADQIQTIKIDKQ